ncbi:MAG: hypothetical protein JWM48_2038 [Mycobacterium sp.]|nr:hypothetical protein [Mycobacterium sp.]
MATLRAVTALPLSAHPATTRLRDDAPTGTGRSLAGYLLVPRPKDLVKAVVAPLGFAVGTVAVGGVAAEQAGRAVLVWLALELLVYQARYQWNDVRGFAADQAHPDAAARGRLPGPLEKARPHIAASLAVMALRLGLTAALAVAVPGVAGVLLAMTVGVFGAAVVYERLRSAATGRTSTVPVPLRPALLALWVVAGAGYAVRGMTGLALAVDLTGRPALVAAAALAMWALGVVFVTCRWTLEAMRFARVEDDRLAWRVRPDQAREHTLGLVRWLPGDASGVGDRGPCAWRALQGRTPLLAPWNLALVIAGGSAAVAGTELVDATGDVDGFGALGTGALGALAALAVALLPRRRRAVTLAGVLVLAVLHVALGGDRPLAAVLPWTVVLAAYGCFTRQCADEVGDTLRRLRPPQRA